MANVVLERRKEGADALNKARNFFKHASSSKPNQVLAEFSDDQNLFAILFAAYGARLLAIEMPETKVFGGWIQVVEPKLVLNPPPQDFVAGVFGDIGNHPRSVQKQIGRDTLSLLLTGKLPEQPGAPVALPAFSGLNLFNVIRPHRESPGCEEARRRASHYPVPISADLAERLAAMDRSANAPLLTRPGGKPWRRSNQAYPFRRTQNEWGRLGQFLGRPRLQRRRTKRCVGQSLDNWCSQALPEAQEPTVTANRFRGASPAARWGFSYDFGIASPTGDTRNATRQRGFLLSDPMVRQSDQFIGGARPR